jgi:hypothetical protein
VHVNRGVKAAHKLIEESLLSASSLYINVLDLLNQAVLLIDGIPNLLALICSE